jgi:hypothetical protein
LRTRVVTCRALLLSLLRIVGDRDDYFVSGSLSFLPLTGHRKPGNDVDAFISRALFRERGEAIRREGKIRTVRLGEFVRRGQPPGMLRARSSVVQLSRPEGHIDLACYRRRDSCLSIGIGLGLSLSVPDAVLERVRTLRFMDLAYPAAPLELAFTVKALEHLHIEQGRKPFRPAFEKHRADVVHLAPLVDWELVESLVADGGLRWCGRVLPRRQARRRIEATQIRASVERLVRG